MSVSVAAYLASFDSQPRSPKEFKERDRAVAAWLKRADAFKANQVAAHTARYREALQLVHDINHAMTLGGAKTVGSGRIPLQEHLRDIEAFQADLDAAEVAAEAAIAAVEAIRDRDSLELWEEHLRRFPQLATRIAIEDMKS